MAQGSFVAVLAQLPVVHQTVLLIVAAGLCGVLLLLLRKRDEDGAATKAQRPTPGSIDDLARLVFKAAVEADIDAYRDLFLAGGEVRQVLGPSAGDYMSRRSLDALENSLATIGAMIPEGSAWVAAERSTDGRLALKVQPPEGEAVVVGIGTFAEVAGVYRMHEPAFADLGPREPVTSLGG